jgi:hypothetical protein
VVPSEKHSTFPAPTHFNAMKLLSKLGVDNRKRISGDQSRSRWWALTFWSKKGLPLPLSPTQQNKSHGSLVKWSRRISNVRIEAPEDPPVASSSSLPVSHFANAPLPSPSSPPSVSTVTLPYEIWRMVLWYLLEEDISPYTYCNSDTYPRLNFHYIHTRHPTYEDWF